MYFHFTRRNGCTVLLIALGINTPPILMYWLYSNELVARSYYENWIHHVKVRFTELLGPSQVTMKL
jgi:hypothetical protein